jgi:uncharacterized membrane protein YbhN (UPF0104 family)
VKKTVTLIVKLTITLALLYFAVSRINFDIVAQRLEHVVAGWLIAAILVMVAQAFLAALRWQIILRRCGALIPFSHAVRYTFISLFFSQVLPSTIGGDAARIWLTARDGVGWSKAISSVIIDRAAGVFFLALIVVVCLPESFAVIHDPLARSGLLSLGLLGVTAPVLFIGFGCREWTVLHRIPLARQINAAANAAYGIFITPHSSLAVGSLSLIIQLLTIVASWLAARSIAAPFDFLTAVLLIPPVLLMATVPISIAGWGVRESAMMMAFSYSGLLPADGLLVSALLGFTTFAVGLIGGSVWALRDRGKEPAITEEPGTP